MDYQVPHEKRKIKVGLLLASPVTSAWKHALIEQLCRSEVAEIAFWAAGSAATGSAGNDRVEGLYRAYRSFDEARHSMTADACELRDATPLLAGTPRSTFPVAFEVEDAPCEITAPAGLEALGLDLVIALDAGLPAEPLRDLCTLGLWRFHHGGSRTTYVNDRDIGLWEVLGKDPHIFSELLQLAPGDQAESVIYQSCSAVDHLSHAKSRNEHLWKVLTFVPRALRRLHRDGAVHPVQSELALQRNAGQWLAPRTRIPSNRHLAMPLTRYFAWRAGQRLVRRYTTEKWTLLYDVGPASDEFSSFIALDAPPDRFWADPFVVHRKGRTVVFFENASVATGIGHISVIEMNADGEFGPPADVLQRPYHLSYPFVFEWNDELYMIPESAENESIELYRCMDFPGQWEYVRHLMANVEAYDATLLRHDGLWWMFANIREHEGASTWDELCLFYAEDPVASQWTPHPMNPIVSDTRFARPAGRIFPDSGRLLRPSQNSTFRYGYALNIMEILELTTSRYAERLLKSYEPNWHRSIKAVHTYSRGDGLTFIDAICRTRRSSTA